MHVLGAFSTIHFPSSIRLNFCKENIVLHFTYWQLPTTNLEMDRNSHSLALLCFGFCWFLAVWGRHLFLPYPPPRNSPTLAFELYLQILRHEETNATQILKKFKCLQNFNIDRLPMLALSTSGSSHKLRHREFHTDDKSHELSHREFHTDVHFNLLRHAL